MDVNKILSADILDIIFEGRNKEYGAYELRKTYNQRMFRAMIVTIVILLLLLGGFLLANKISESSTNDVVVQDVQLEEIKQEEKKPEPPPPPPPPKPEPPKVEITNLPRQKLLKTKR